MRLTNDLIEVDIVPTSLENYNKIFYNTTVNVPVWANNESLLCYTTTPGLKTGQLVSARGYIVVDYYNHGYFKWVSEAPSGTSYEMRQLMIVGSSQSGKTELTSYSIAEDYLEFYRSLLLRFKYLDSQNAEFVYPNRKMPTADGFNITPPFVESISVSVIPIPNLTRIWVFYGNYRERTFTISDKSGVSAEAEFKKDTTGNWILSGADTMIESYNTDPNKYFLSITFKSTVDKFNYTKISSDEILIDAGVFSNIDL